MPEYRAGYTNSDIIWGARIAHYGDGGEFDNDEFAQDEIVNIQEGSEYIDREGKNNYRISLTRGTYNTSFNSAYYSNYDYKTQTASDKFTVTSVTDEVISQVSHLFIMYVFQSKMECLH